MSLDSIVNVSITSTSRTPTRQGFGTALILAQKLPAGWGPNLTRLFSSLKELTDLGFAVTDPAYKAASALLAQNPSVKQFKIGKRALAATRTVKLTVTVATTGYVYAFSVDGTALTYTVLGGATTTTVATALAALIDALANVAATSTGADITITAAAGVCFDVSGWYANKMTLADTTTDPGIATDLANILVQDTDWYGVSADQAGKAESIAAAAWVESNGKLALFDTSDSACADSGSTTDVMYVAKGSAYARTGWIFGNASLLSYAAIGLLGSRLPATPGSDTFAFKTLASVPVSTMTAGEETAVLNKNGNTYTTIAGLNVTQGGKSASGEYLDVTRFSDWLRAEIKVRVFTRLAGADKVPYTDSGVDSIVGIVKGALQDGVRAKGLAESPAPTVSAPLVADVDSVSKAGRTLPNVAFTGQLAGAIHALTISGVLSV